MYIASNARGIHNDGVDNALPIYFIESVANFNNFNTEISSTSIPAMCIQSLAEGMNGDLCACRNAVCDLAPSEIVLQ